MPVVGAHGNGADVAVGDVPVRIPAVVPWPALEAGAEFGRGALLVGGLLSFVLVQPDRG